MGEIAKCFTKNSVDHNLKCSFQTLVVVFSFICLCLTVFLLVVELLKRKFTLKVLMKPQLLVFIIMTIGLLNCVLHYTVYSDSVSEASVITNEFFRFFCFFFVCYYFCKKSSYILPNGKKWIIFL